MDAEIQSLKQQIGNLRANLEAVRIKRSAIADPRDITDDLRIQEEYLTDEINKLEIKLRRLERQYTEKLKKSQTFQGRVRGWLRDSAWGGVSSVVAVLGLLWGFYVYFIPKPSSAIGTPTATATIAAVNSTPTSVVQSSQALTPTFTVTNVPTITPTPNEVVTPTTSPTNTATPSLEPAQTDTPVPTNSPTPQPITNTTSPIATSFQPDLSISQICTGTVVQIGVENQIMIYTDATATRTLSQTIPTDNLVIVHVIDASEGINLRYKIEYQPVTSGRVFIGWVDGRQIKLDTNNSCQKIAGR